MYANGSKKVAFSFDGVDFDYSEQFTMGAFIADYKFDKYNSEKKDNKIKEIYVSASEEGVKKGEKIVLSTLSTAFSSLNVVKSA